MTVRTPVRGDWGTGPRRARPAPTDPVVVRRGGGNGGSGGGGDRTYGSRDGGSGGSGGGGGDGGAEARARRSANNGARQAANSQLIALQQAIDAALAQRKINTTSLSSLGELVGGDLKEARKTTLAGVEENLDTMLTGALDTYSGQLTGLNSSLRDNEAASSDSTMANLVNRARESQDLASAALSQGAGESDVLKSQVQALRNWSANQGEVNRSFIDTLTSVNSSLTDLNTGTHSAMIAYENDANERRGQVWGDYFTGMADSYTQMDNLAANNYLLDREIAANRRNMGDQNSLINWIRRGRNAEDWVPTPAEESVLPPYDGYSDEAADWAGRAWTNPGVSDETENWTGQQTRKGKTIDSKAFVAGINTARGPARARPEGATLRTW